MFKGGTAAAGATAEQDLPLSYARTLSWLSLLVIMATSLVLSFFIANSAREALLTRQENFSRLLAENLNHQIYRRFALPTLLAHGRIALRQPSQYERLDQVVQSVVHGLPMERLRIYDFTRVVAYSTSREELGRMGVGPESLDDTLRGGVPKPELISNIPDWRAIFHLPLPSGTFVLRTLYPLRGEPLQPGAEPPIMGALELTQDITSDYEQILLFQGVVVVTCLLSSVIMFALLLMLIQRAERVLADRMAKNRQLENELHSNEKLVSMGRVIASIAHEIRNPLGIIRSSAELLQRRMGKADAGTEIVSDGTKWDYKNTSDIRYWPTQGETLSFYAYAPYTKNGVAIPVAYTKGDGMIMTDYTVPADDAGQVDLMYASALNVAKASPAVKVPLQFKHAMTQVRFKAKAKGDGVFIDVKENGIKLRNLESKGTFTLSAAGAASWSITEGNLTEYTAVFPETKEITNAEAKNLYDADKALILLPQEFAAKTGDGDMTGGTLTISCKIYYKDNNATPQYLFGSADTYADYTVPFSSKKVTGDTEGEEIWKMNKRITYTLTVTGNLEPILFETSVVDWEDSNADMEI